MGITEEGRLLAMGSESRQGRIVRTNSTAVMLGFVGPRGSQSTHQGGALKNGLIVPHLFLAHSELWKEILELHLAWWVVSAAAGSWPLCGDQ